MNRKPLTDADGEVRELEDEDFARMRPAAEVLPADLMATIAKRGAGERIVQNAPIKERVTLRLDRDILDRFRADGPGWQDRINEALRKAQT